MELACALGKSAFDGSVPFATPWLYPLTVVQSRFALVQMKLMLAMVLRKYSVTVDDTQNEDEMEGLQMAVLAPKRGRCLLKFSHRKNKNA